MQNLPDDNFYCPITYGIMMDPVIGPDGQTYERSAIESWLISNNKSPLTKQTMKVSELVPNIALRNTIQQYLKLNPSMNQTKKQVPIVPNIKITRSINIQPVLTSDHKLIVSLKSNEEVKRKPSAFIFIIDVSGSMDSDASNNTNSWESDGFTRLDLVKHSVRTVIEVLEPSDMISLITFSDDAKLKLDFCSMTPEGKENAIQILNSLRTEGMTNIWDGLRVGLLNIQKIQNQDVNIGLVLLTDGEPNTNPPRGIVPTLESAIESLKIQKPFTINTFGFGYSLDSKLLDQIARCGYGTFGYIPDSSMVGTIFVNYLSNVLSTYLSNSKIIIESEGQVIVSENIGSIYSDKSRDLVYQLTKSYDQFKITLLVGDQILESKEVGLSELTNSYNHQLITGSNVRHKIYSTIYKILEDFEITKSLDSANHQLNELYEEIKMMNEVNETTEVSNYLLDWDSPDEFKGGQIRTAFSRTEWFSKWGSHFIRSIMNAYKNQQCNNFKDPGVQNFAGDLFTEIRKTADAAFCMLPAPKSSSHRNYYSRGNTTTTRTQPINMTSYYDAGGGCYDGEGLVLMHDGTFKQVKSIVKGDIIMALDKNLISFADKIKCVVKSKVVNGSIPMCLINGLTITPWHPLLNPNSNNNWIFPINISPEQNVKIDWIYNIVLESGVSVCINGLMMSTLGHGLNDPIISHNYFGTQNIINDLSQMEGWNNGLVILENPMVMRSNGQVAQLINNC